MGTCSSKNIRLSIDVKGNNNYALLINDEETNLASVLQNIINQNNSENRTMTIILCLSCMFFILFFGVIVISVQSYVIKEDIKHSIRCLNRKIEHLSSLLLQQKTNSQIDNIHIAKYPQSSF